MDSIKYFIISFFLPKHIFKLLFHRKWGLNQGPAFFTAFQVIKEDSYLSGSSSTPNIPVNTW